MGAFSRGLTTVLFMLIPLAGLLALPGVTPAGETLPDAETILAKVKAAAAMPAVWHRTTETVASNGTITHTTLTRFDDDWREVDGSGAFHYESGHVKGEDWHQNENGQTVLDEPDPGISASDHITPAVTRVHTPVEGYEIAALNVRGFGSRRVVDGSTWQTVRVEDITANGKVVTSYDDFRSEGTRVFAHHWHVEDGYNRTSSDTRVTAYAASASQADVAMPGSRRSLVQFPSGVDRVAIPAQFTNDHIIVPVMIGNRRLDFVLDTGASGIALDRDVARQLGLASYDEHSEVTAQRYTAASSIIPEMRVGDLTLRDVAVSLVPQGFKDDVAVKTVGLLGFDFIAELGITIDYESQRVSAVPGEHYQPPSGAHVLPLDVRIGDGSPYVVVAIDGIVAERFLIDTGGAGALMINDVFTRKHPDVLRKLTRAEDMQFEGIGGEFSTKAYLFPSVRMGSINFQDFVGYVVTSPAAYDGTDDGIIGPELLKYFTVGLDYGNARVYLAPNDLGRRAMHLAK